MMHYRDWNWILKLKKSVHPNVVVFMEILYPKQLKCLFEKNLDS